MKKKYFLWTILGALAITMLGVNIASAHGWFGPMWNESLDDIASRHQAMFQNQAQILGIGLDEIKNGWAQGKTLWEIAKDKGITQEQLQQKMKDAQMAKMKEQLKTLVDKGIITQTQADQRIQFMENKVSNAKMGKGFGFHRGFRF